MEVPSQALCREAVMWKRLMHLNIVPLLGVIVTPPQLILEWVSNGNLQEYIEKYPGVDRLGLVSTPFGMVIQH